MAAAAAGADGLDEVIELVADAALEAIGAGSLSIGRWERDTERMRILINVGTLGPWEERFPADETYPLRDFPIVATLLRDAKPYFTAVDDPDAPSPPPSPCSRASARSRRSGCRSWSTARCGERSGPAPARAPRASARRDVRFLEAIAGQLTAVVGRAELFTKVSRLAYEDPLTGLGNRRGVRGGPGGRGRPGRASRGLR